MVDIIVATRPPDVSLETTDRIQKISKTVLVITADRKGIRAEVFCLLLIRRVLMVKTWNECVENDLKRVNLDSSMADDRESRRWLVRVNV